MMTTAPTMLMMVAAVNRSRPLLRPSREIHKYDDNDIYALPGPGVYWDTNVLMRLKGDPGINGSVSVQKHTTGLESDTESQEGSNTLTDHDADFPAEHNDHDDSALSMTTLQLKPNKHGVEMGKEISAYSNSFLHKQLDISGKELTQHQDISLSNDGYPIYDKNLTPTSTASYYTKHYQDNDDYEFTVGSRHGWDYYEEYDGTPQVDSLVATEHIDGAYVRDKYEVDLYPITKLGNHAWITATSVYKQLRSSLNVVQCYELVVCEAHRVGRAWGDSGVLLASGLSEIMMWLYGEDDEHKRLITEAATTGGQRHSCWVQMQQCEDKSRDRSVLPIMARLLEKFF